MRHSHFAIAVSAACLALGCGTEEPTPEETGDYFPLAVGNYWKYQETGYDEDSPAASRIIGHEVVDFIEMDFEHDTEGALPVFVVEATFPPPSEDGSDDPRLEYIYDDGTRAVRKRQEIYDRHNTSTMIKMRDYEPGLLRFDRGKTVVGDRWIEQQTLYTVSFPAEEDDDSWPSAEYTYEILDPMAVTVPAGTFDCFVLLRNCTGGSSNGERKVYYFAPGVGKVKEDTGNGKKVEELVEYNVEVAADGGV